MVILKVVQPVEQDGKKFDSGMRIWCTAEQAAKLIESKAARELTEEEK